MRPSAAPESDHGDGAPARDRGAARPSGALTQVPSTAPNPQIPPRAPRYARAPLTLRPTPAAALVQPWRACAEPADRPVQARAGGPCLRRRSPGAGSRRHRRPRGRRHLAARRLFSSLSIGAARPQTSHMPHTPLTRFALFVQVACCGVSPPAALRLARAGTRRAARPRPRPCTQPPPSPQRAIPLPALTLPAPALCRPCVSPRAHEATLLFPRPSLLFLCRCSLP